MVRRACQKPSADQQRLTVSNFSAKSQNLQAFETQNPTIGKTMPPSRAYMTSWTRLLAKLAQNETISMPRSKKFTQIKI